MGQSSEASLALAGADEVRRQKRSFPRLGDRERSFAGPRRSGRSAKAKEIFPAFGGQRAKLRWPRRSRRSAEAKEIFSALWDSRAKLRWPSPERTKCGGKGDLPALGGQRAKLHWPPPSRRSAKAKRLYAQEPCGQSSLTEIFVRQARIAAPRSIVTIASLN
ncbi:hypothetical protein BK126_20425 [Paenibacillus sp. FSL H7-0326]|nr:hypothetical protein BK126_20425 [Paenibacillus sp. FSL H7-0326]